MWRFTTYYQLSKQDQLQSWSHLHDQVAQDDSQSSSEYLKWCMPYSLPGSPIPAFNQTLYKNNYMMHKLHFLSCIFAFISPYPFTVHLWQETDSIFSISSLQSVDDKRLWNRNGYFAKSSDKKLKRSSILHRSLFICNHLSFPSINFLQKEPYYNWRGFFCVLLKELFDRDYHFPWE